MESTYGDTSMKRRLLFALAAVALATAAAVGATTAAAATLVSLVGDKDGLGLGLASGDGFDSDLVDPGDGDGTDKFLTGNFLFVHDYALAGAVTSASLEIFSGGLGRNALSGVFLNGTFIGNLTDGDDVGPLYNYAFKDVFDLTPFVALLTGHDSVEIHPASPLLDGGAVDYSELSVTFGPAAAVAEPSGAALAGLALAALAASARRRGAKR